MSDVGTQTGSAPAAHAAHSTFLAIIAVLAVIIVCVVAKSIVARRALAAAKKSYGVRGVTKGLREKPLRLAADDPSKPHSLTFYQQQMAGIIGAAKRERTGDMVEACLLLEVARVANLERMTNADSGDFEAVDAAEAALAIEQLRLAIDNNNLQNLAIAIEGIDQQVRWLWKHVPNLEGIDRRAVEAHAAVGKAVTAATTQHEPVTAEQTLAAIGDNAAIFECAAIVGWLVAGGKMEKVPQIRAAGKYLGIASGIAWATPYDIRQLIGDVAAIDEIDRNIAACRLVVKRLSTDNSPGSGLWEDMFKRIKEIATARRRREGEEPLHEKLSKPISAREVDDNQAAGSAPRATTAT